jgi:two-component system sensor histidine kinase YesM
VNQVKLGLFLRYLSIVLIPILVLLVMGTISIIINQKYAERQIRESNERTLEQISNSIDFTFQELDSLDVIFSTSAEFLVSLDRILASQALDFEQSKVLSAIQNFINVSAYARPYVESIYVYIQNGNDRLLTTNGGIVDLGDYSDRDWFDSYIKHAQTDTFWTETRLLKRLPSVEESRPVVSIFRRIYPLVGVRAPGVVVLNIYRDYLGLFLDNLKSSSDQRIQIVDNTGKVVLSDFPGGMAPVDAPTPDGGGPVVLGDGERYIAARLVSPKYGWTYLSFTPAARFYEVSRTLRTINVAVVIFCTLVGSLITFYASRRAFRHIEGVLDIVDAAERGAPLPAAPESADRGFSHVTYSILTTFLEHKYLQVQLSERKYRQKTLELLALQSQMNPHFLFNTLETINWKVIKLTRKPNRINGMIRSLSNILKYALQSPITLETLSNEIDHAKDYLSIQRIRYRNKFAVTWDCPPGLEERTVIRFLLQPLLENAIYHGIKEKEGRGSITVTIREAGGGVRVVVSDNGLGIEPERLQEIRGRLRENSSEGEAVYRGIGLFNTNKRIKLAFGEEYGIGIDSTFGRGTSVTVDLPSGK